VAWTRAEGTKFRADCGQGQGQIRNPSKKQ